MSLLRAKMEGRGLSGGALSGGALSGGYLKGADLGNAFNDQLQADIAATHRKMPKNAGPGLRIKPKIPESKEVSVARQNLNAAMTAQRQANTNARLAQLGPTERAKEEVKLAKVRAVDRSAAAATRAANTAARNQELLQFETTHNVKLSKDERDLFLLYSKFDQRAVQRARANQKAALKRAADKADKGQVI
jgi:hypothetical protein